MGSVQHEAERLVDEAFGVASRLAADLPAAAGCGCPVCRVVTAVRDPDPDLTARVSGVVGDIAGGVADALRSLSDLGTGRPGTGQHGGSATGGTKPSGQPDPGDPAGTGRAKRGAEPGGGSPGAGRSERGADPGARDGGSVGERPGASRTEGSAGAGGRATEKGDPGCH